MALDPAEFAGADYSNAKFPEPRAWQVKALAGLRQGFKEGRKRQILVAPTGAGKTQTSLQLTHGSLLKGKRATFVCDRTVLIEQTSKVADSLGLNEHGIIQANHWRRANHLRMQIASVQTLQARGYWPASDLLVIDEAHVLYKITREKLEKNDCAVIGLTATPCTKGLGKYYDGMVNPTTMAELTDQGILVPMRVFVCESPDMRGASLAEGEWTNKDAAERELTIVGDVVAEWIKNGEDRKTIAFGPTIDYCRELVKRFDQAGVQALTYTSDDDKFVRQAVVEEFSKPDSKIKILASVSALSRGFDVRDVSCIIHARPLRKSLSEFIQAIGRGLRCSPETSKKDCIVLDHGGNFARFYDDFVDIYHNGFKSLDDAEKVDAKPREEKDFEPNGCPQCGFSPFRKRCMQCGYERPVVAAVEERAGTMKEIVIGKNKAADSRAHLWQQLCAYSARSKNPHKRACGLYRDIVGEWPPRGWDWSKTTPAQPTGATLGKIKSLNIAWVKGREKGRRLAQRSNALDSGFKRAMQE
ncbi:MAG: DEAD/DEAH box helicase family protein [Patescibacteria group bacterium]|nr:DEAD/DEAH box helicase family protein [Patescibacteria group bacterium]